MRSINMFNKKIIILISLGFFLLTGVFYTNVFSEEKKDKEEKKEEKNTANIKAEKDVPKPVTSRLYSDEEIRNLINKEVDKRIDRYKPSEMAKLSKEFMKMDSEMKEKEQKLKTREEQLSFNEKELSKKILEFEKTQEKVLGCMDQNNRESEERINRIVSVISEMRPQMAAEVLSVQDPNIAVKIISMIDPNKASKIFNLMDKEISARIQKQYLNMKK
ncbi:MAG: hypothetical protein HQK49_16610 [Oligoflexia bacterium]|nr:hypothetical protein [Oligoflexia bacterium]